MTSRLRKTNGRKSPPTRKNDSLVIRAKYDDEDVYDDSSSQLTETGSDAKTWEVERVLGKRFDDQGELSFLLKWKSYDELTWEPVKNLSCDQLILDFEDKSSLNKWRENSCVGNRLRSPGMNGSRSNKNQKEISNLRVNNFNTPPTKRTSRNSTRP